MPMVQFEYTYDIPNELCVDPRLLMEKPGQLHMTAPDKLFSPL